MEYVVVIKKTTPQYFGILGLRIERIVFNYLEIRYLCHRESDNYHIEFI
jgi:hypothetical protein